MTRKIFLGTVILILLTIILLSAAVWNFSERVETWWNLSHVVTVKVPAVTFVKTTSDIISPDEVVSATEIEQVPVTDERPLEFNLAVPWTPQAPEAVWDKTHEEACEEAAIFMVRMFYNNWPAGLIDPITAETEIQELIQQEINLLGYFESTSAEQTVEVIRKVYGYDSVLLIDPTVDQIKDHLLAGWPVIAPMAGQVLANPYFTPPGPVYHMLVIKGYTPDGFITNDPGTRHGQDWFYDYDHLMGALHDWNNGDVLNGEKVVIIIEPRSETTE